MSTFGILERAANEHWTDQQVVDRVRSGETALYEILMRRYNQRLYRVTCAILRDSAEAEDVIQDAYVRAYQHLDQFAGTAPFSTWLTRIAVNEALRRLHLRRRSTQFEVIYDGDETMSDAESNVPERSPDPEQRASIAELGRLLEEAVLNLPEQYRAVIMLRDVEELTTAETAASLDLTEDNVKVRLHRGRAMMRDRLFARVGAGVKTAFPFMGERCDRVVLGVFARLRTLDSNSEA
jgi:RNA polymerase sigma-70 factor (ECF subfamily)